MKFKLVFLCMVGFGIGDYVRTRGIPNLTNIPPNDFSIYAVVESATLRCSGIFITNSFVVTPAYCVNGSSSVKVFRPNMSGDLEQNLEYRVSSDIFIHNEFVKLEHYHYLNNIALVKLPALQATVIPGNLIARNQVRLIEGNLVNVSGKIKSQDGKYLKFFTAPVESEETCSYLLRNRILREHEICLKLLTPLPLIRLGNIVSVDDKIIGFITNTPDCVVKIPHCESMRFILIFSPFLKWMSDKMNIPIEQFTSNNQDTSNNAHFNEDLINKMNDIQTQIEALKTTINTSSQNEVTFQKELNNLKAEIASGVGAQKGLNDLEAKFNDLNNNSQHKVKENIMKLKEEFNNLMDTNKNITLIEEQHFLQQKQEITSLREKVNDLDKSKRELKSQQELVEHIDATIKDVSNSLKKLGKEQDEIEETVERNLLKEDLRLDDIEKVYGEQKNNIDKYIIQEVAQSHSLWAEIRSLNDSVNKLTGFIYDEPLSN